jgi:hypothetical protein
VGIVLGVISGISHFVGFFLPSIVGFLGIAGCVCAAELYCYRKALKFAANNPSSQDPLLALISRFNSLTLVTRLLHVIKSLVPILNFLSALFLSVVIIVGVLNVFYQESIQEQIIL